MIERYKGALLYGHHPREVRDPGQRQDTCGGAASCGERGPAAPGIGRRGPDRPYREAPPGSAALACHGCLPAQPRSIWRTLQEAGAVRDYLTLADVLAI